MFEKVCRMTGFGAVPEELTAVAERIGGTVGKATDCGWNGPSGDYGHPGVFNGWEQFIRDMQKHFEFLKSRADDFGTGLAEAARDYIDTDVSNTADFGKIGQGIGQGPGLGQGIMNPEVAKRLSPNARDVPYNPEGPIF